MTAQGDPGTLPRSQVLLELDRLDAGSAVALVGHPIHVMMVHFPIAFVIATLGVDVFYWLCLPIMPSEHSTDGDRRAK